MDTTKQNILMCEKAEKIQKEWKLCVGDFCFKKERRDNWVEVADYQDVAEGMNIKRYIWLPRQDQLQEIYRKAVKCSKGKSATFRLAMDISCWLGNRQYPQKFTSMEQLWLAFVMRKKYQEVWNGAEWIRCIT